MKTLANCKPSEFLVQTNKIRHAVEKWLKMTDIQSLREKVPPFVEGQTPAERKKALAEQSRKNLSAILDTIMEEHPQETVELLGMLCFIEPENVDDYPVRDYLEAFNELLNDTAVVGFFMSLIRLGQTDI